MAADEALPARDRVEPALAAEPGEPALARGDMADLVGIDAAEDGRARRIAEKVHAVDHGRRDVEPARFEDERHDGEPCQKIARRLLRRLPQTVMRGEIAIGGAELAEALCEKGEVLGLLGG